MGARGLRDGCGTRCARACGNVPRIRDLWALRSVNLLPSLRRRRSSRAAWRRNRTGYDGPDGGRAAESSLSDRAQGQPAPHAMVRCLEEGAADLLDRVDQGYDPPPVPADQYDRILEDLGQPDYEIAGPARCAVGRIVDQDRSVLAAGTHGRDQATYRCSNREPSRAIVIKTTSSSSRARPCRAGWKSSASNFRGKLVGIYTISNSNR